MYFKSSAKPAAPQATTSQETRNLMKELELLAARSRESKVGQTDPKAGAIETLVDTMSELSARKSGNSSFKGATHLSDPVATSIAGELTALLLKNKLVQMQDSILNFGKPSKGQNALSKEDEMPKKKLEDAKEDLALKAGGKLHGAEPDLGKLTDAQLAAQMKALLSGVLAQISTGATTKKG